MKKKALMPSILTIALCVILIVGSTYALFTSQSRFNVSVTSGKVDVSATVTDLTLWSAEEAQAQTDSTKYYETDEFGGLYGYELQLDANGNVSDKFANEGTAKFEDSVLTMERVTPGDMVKFNLNGTNNSNVAIKYRYIIECVDGYSLMSGLIIRLDGDKNKEYASVLSYTSDWMELGANATFDDVAISLRLPIYAGNEYQDLHNTSINVTVEAVQANGIVSGSETIKYIANASTAAELKSALENDAVEYINVTKNINEKVEVTKPTANKLVDGKGHNVVLEFNGALENVVLANIGDTNDNVPAISIKSLASGELTVRNSTLYDVDTPAYGAIAGSDGNNTAFSLKVEGCTFNGTGAKERTFGIYMANANNITVKNSNFVNLGEWPVYVDGAASGNVVVDGCTFSNCYGVITADVTGNLTFTNNTITNCSLVDSATGLGSTTTGGTLTFTGNTINGAPVDVAAMGDMN